MTKLRVWKTLAIAYGTPRSERTKEQRDLTRYGLCGGIQWLLESDETKMRVLFGVIRDSIPRGPWRGYYFCALSPANDILRSDFCWFQYYRAGGK